MPNYSTYAFEDLAVVINHPSKGQLTLQGEGLGSITFAMANDVSSHDLAADGSVMTSKIKAGNGTVTISVQQTSSANKWFRDLYNYLEPASSSEWSEISLMAESKVMGVTYTATNMSFQKKPDGAYQQSGQQVSWAFLAGDIKEVSI